MNYNFQFDKNRYRVLQCPCGKSNNDGKFTPYIGYDDKGYCFGCGTSYLPDGVNSSQPGLQTVEPFIEKEPSFIAAEILVQSQRDYGQNNLVSYLLKLIGADRTKQVIRRYHIGTSKHWRGATIHWQIDNSDNIRAGKIMLYNPATGKRIKEPRSYITWVHKELKLPDFNLKQCFYGEHLLKQYPSMPVALVESEKTAIIASAYLPQFIWLATGSKANLKPKLWYCLLGRNVILYPDTNAHRDWTEKATILKSVASNVKISDLLEQNATEGERKQGLDIADYLVKFAVEKFNLSIPSI